MIMSFGLTGRLEVTLAEALFRFINCHDFGRVILMKTLTQDALVVHLVRQPPLRRMLILDFQKYRR